VSGPRLECPRPLDGSQAGTGRTGGTQAWDDNGKKLDRPYPLQFCHGDGAPPGEYAVTFELVQAAADKAGRDAEADIWKERYADPAGMPVRRMLG
jgi:hypothetical protein